MSEAYIPKSPNELIRAADWNAIQILARDALANHTHDGEPDQGSPIGSGGLAGAAVTTEKLAAAAVTTEKLAAAAVTAEKLNDAAVTNEKLANASVSAAKLATAAVTADKLADAAVTANKLGSAAVTADKLADASVSTAKLGGGAVTADKLGSAAVTEVKLANTSVTAAKLANAAVTEMKLANTSVTEAKLADASVSTAKLTTAAVTTDKLADASVSTAKLATDAVTTSKVANGSITKAKLAQPLRILTPVGGDGQLGRPGDTLKIALRVRVSDGDEPIAGALVRFELLTKYFNGTKLDQITGGCLHASTNRVSGTRWPAGCDQIVVVRTNERGIAQVQHILGTETQLPVRRVKATLLDPRFPQTALFTAHLLVGTEVGCIPSPVLSTFMTPESDRNVQASLDGVANALRKLGALALAATPLTLNGEPITPGLELPLAKFEGVRVRGILAGGVQASNLDALPLCVWAELPRQEPLGWTLVRLEGTLTQDEDGDLVWEIAPAAKDWFRNDGPCPLRLVIELTPWALGLDGPPQRWPVWLT